MASDYENRLRQIAEEEGMPWGDVRRVIAAEGGFTDPFNRSKGKQNGVQEYSLGPLQLNMREGVGVEAKKAGFDASKDWEGAYRFGLNWAKKHGWNDWMGARKIGLAGAQGKYTGGKGDQYALKRKHLGGAGSKPGNFVDVPAVGAPATATEPLPPEPIAGDKKDEKNAFSAGFAKLGDAFGDAIQDPMQINTPMNVEMGGGGPMPSVYRPQLMPTQVPIGAGGMGGGGGQDMRQLLALLMRSGLG